MGAQDGQVVGTVRIVDHGSPARRFNLVLVAEGYQPAELAQFAADCQRFVDHLFRVAPFDELRCAFNVYQVDVQSTDSGADDPAACGGSGATPATYFDASFCNAGIRRLLLVDTASVISVVNAQVPQWHQVLVIVNSNIWGGAGGNPGTTSTAPGWENIAVHEIGHSVFGLADEYDYWAGCGVDTDRDNYSGPEPSEPNITTVSNRASIKWGNLIDASTPMPTTSNPDCTQCDPQASPVTAGTVGAFEGAGYYHCGLYRPQFDCMMRNLTAFCEVCRQRIRQTMRPFLASCYAPVFKGCRIWGLPWCPIVLLGFSLAVIPIGLLSLWKPRFRCRLKQILYRISHAWEGNFDPCVEL